MERARAIYDYAIDLQPEERRAFLRQISSEDPKLLAEVQRMLDEATADTEEIAPTPINTAVPSHKYIFSAGDLIAGRYRVLRTVAKGGMGEVYEVHDIELHSRVALKVISLKSAAKPNSAEMFRREILLARQVTHPNVCRIYDIGHHDHPEHGDVVFLTMEFLEGITLADRVRNQGPLQKEDALPLIQQMVQALAAAHRLNIAHRDFKSGNVILCEPKSTSGSQSVKAPSGLTSAVVAQQSAKNSSGPDPLNEPGASKKTGSVPDVSSRLTGASPSSSADAPAHRVIVKVTDFGLARSLDGMETTFQGEVWGTPDYMAPEQFHGQSSISSDIYALGVVIYEIFTAKLPHRSNTGSQTADGKPSTAMEKIPPEWRPVVRKCMAYEPADRYATVNDVWGALVGEPSGSAARARTSSRIMTALAVFVLVAGLASWIWRDAIRQFLHPVPEQKHIAVLPFQSLGGDSDSLAFSQGIGETLTSKLSQLGADHPLYWVVPFSDSRKYTDVEQARRNLDVTMVVTGSVQRTGDKVQVTTSVIDAKRHKVLGSRVMTAAVGDLSVLQDETWESVADLVQMPVDKDTKSTVTDSNTKSSRAYDYYEQGVGYLQRGNLADVDKAIEAFQKSAAEDPNYALALAGLGGAYATKYHDTKDPEWIKYATDNGNRALALNPNLAPVRETLGKIYENTGKFDEALAEYRRAVELNSLSIIASYHVAKIYMLQGKYGESEAAYKRVIDRMPSFWLGYSGLGELYFSQGKFSEAAEQFQKMIERMPDNPLGYEDLGGTYAQMGKYDKAIEVFKKGLSVKPSPEVWSNLGGVYMFVGDNAKAVDAMSKAVELNPHDHTLWRNLADSYRKVPSLADRANPTYQKALAAAQEQLKVNPNDKDALSGVALYEAHLGNKAEAQKYIAKATQQAPKDSDVLFTAALAYEIIGDREKAIAELQKSLGAGFSLEDMKREPELEALRSDKRYQRMLQGTQAVHND